MTWDNITNTLKILLPYISLIVSVFTLYKTWIEINKAKTELKFREKEIEIKQAEVNQKYDEIKSKYLDILLQKRLETYPELIKITQDLGKTETSLSSHKKAREELKDWIIANHGGYLTLSENTLMYFNNLKDLLKKNAGDGKNYSSDQLSKIFKTRNDLRGSMIDDISIVKNSDTV